MADTMSYDNSIEYTFKLVDDSGNDVGSRTISMPGVDITSAEPPTSVVAAAKEFRTWVLGSASNFIQTSTWRDSNDDEEEYKTADVEITFKSLMSQKIDPEG